MILFIGFISKTIDLEYNILIQIDFCWQQLNQSEAKDKRKFNYTQTKI